MPSMDEGVIRIIIVDDHPLVREGIRSLVGSQEDIAVVGEASSLAEALDVHSSAKPDVSLIDVRLGEESGIKLARSILKSAVGGKVVILTAFDDEDLLAEAVSAGVQGYVLKSTMPQQLLSAIRDVHAGGYAISPNAAKAAFDRINHLTKQLAFERSGLTSEEVRTLVMMADGLTQEKMAERLSVSVRTVRRRIQDVMRKLGASTQAQAVAEGYEREIL